MITKQVIPNLPPVSVPEFKGFPLLGNAAHLLNDVVGWISVDWEGHAENILNIKIPHESWFNPADKGGMSMFGFNKKGEVIIGMVRYQGDSRSKNPFEHGPHYYCTATNCADPWKV